MRDRILAQGAAAAADGRPPLDVEAVKQHSKQSLGRTAVDNIFLRQPLWQLNACVNTGFRVEILEAVGSRLHTMYM